MVERTAPNRRIEEASLNAWPALHQMLLDGWVLRFARGFTKRANSVTPLYAGSQPIDEKVRFCENLYARERLQSVFRITAGADDADQAALDSYLDARGYRLADPSLVLGAPIASEAVSPRWSMLTLKEWLNAYAALTEMPAKFMRLHGAILNTIRTECAHAVLRDGEEVLACGLGVVERGLVGLFDIVTHPAHRRQGCGEELVRGLLAWGRERGAETAYLQVAQANAAAQALYLKLGFAERYRYWYRIAS
ncbi:MAG: GNAT family N-acetyltransferase [Gammaproteobacteria bacterium]|nr:GNAT family N-acetyltransferase [Gammaproteobacteria bacterium]